METGKMMKDLYNQPLEIGDAVAFNPPRYKGLAKGKVVGFTPKMVKIEYNTGFSYEPIATTNVYPQDVAKVGVFAILSQNN